MTDMGEIQSYLGIRILRDRPNRRLEIDQSRYLRGVLARFNMADANLVLPHFPLVLMCTLSNLKDKPRCRHKVVQSIIGSLLYIQIGTRPDISFACPVWHSMHPTFVSA